MKAFLPITAALIFPALLHAQNLLSNGDFEAGKTGFRSQYLSPAGDLSPQETYDVTDNPKSRWHLFPEMGDHTTGTGMMLVVNGSTRSDLTVAWGQDVDVVPGNDYTLKFWAANLYASAPSILIIRINGTQAGQNIQIKQPVAEWNEYSVTWSSGAATTASIELSFASAGFGGNDTGFDDFSFIGSPPAPCADPTAVSNNPSELHTTVTVPGNANPFLAGQPDGARAKSDSAPDQSPVLATQVAGGDVFSFSATGSVSFVGAVNPTTPPDGGGLAGSGSESGIAGYPGVNALPVDTLVGVFLSDAIPADPAPAPFVYGSEMFAFEVLAPQLRQIFYIGDGLTGTATGTRQQFVAPPGATRLYLGTTDGFGWFNNSGAFEVSICRLTDQNFGPRLGPTTIRFDQSAYSIELGQTAAGSLIIDPLPEGGLYSQGMAVTVRSRDGTLAGVITPTAANRLNNDGPLLSTPGVNSAATGTAGIKGSAFFSTERPALTSPTLASFSAADLPPGTYDLAIEPWNELGPTEDIFVTGLCLTLDPFITFGTATLEVMGSLLPEIAVTGPISLQKQTGLLEQRLTLVNNSGRVLNGFRLFVNDLPEGVVLWNAHGTIDGVPYIDYFGEIAVGASFEMILEFYRPSRDTGFSPSFLLAAPGAVPPAGNGTVLNVDLRVVRKSPTGLLIEFLTEKDKSYTIEYSKDMGVWTPSLPPVIGTGQRIQWLDQGPPKTATFPGGSRFYRITTAE